MAPYAPLLRLINNAMDDKAVRQGIYWPINPLWDFLFLFYINKKLDSAAGLFFVCNWVVKNCDLGYDKIEQSKVHKFDEKFKYPQNLLSRLYFFASQKFTGDKTIYVFSSERVFRLSFFRLVSGGVTLPYIVWLRSVLLEFYQYSSQVIVYSLLSKIHFQKIDLVPIVKSFKNEIKAHTRAEKPTTWIG